MKCNARCKGNERNITTGLTMHFCPSMSFNRVFQHAAVRTAICPTQRNQLPALEVQGPPAEVALRPWELPLYRHARIHPPTASRRSGRLLDPHAGAGRSHVYYPTIHFAPTRCVLSASGVNGSLSGAPRLPTTRETKLGVERLERFMETTLLSDRWTCRRLRKKRHRSRDMNMSMEPVISWLLLIKNKVMTSEFSARRIL